MRNAAYVVDQVFDLYLKFGNADYIGEPVSQIEHMSQAAELAMQEGFDDEVILAAFFHDIGHICQQAVHNQSMNGFGRISHEQVGADFLRSIGFTDKMATLVENHVQAKRYLTFRYPDYYNTLSDASRQTLEFQGGIMTKEEAELFENSPLFEVSIRMRKWDERAKERDKPLIDFQVLKTKALNILEKHPH